MKRRRFKKFAKKRNGHKRTSNYIVSRGGIQL